MKDYHLSFMVVTLVISGMYFNDLNPPSTLLS